MLRIILRDKKILIIIGIIIICSIAIAIGVYAQITNAKIIDNNVANNEQNYEELKTSFNSIFNNSIDTNASKQFLNSNINYNDITYLAYDIAKTKDGEYSINANIPMFKLETENTKQINQNIYNMFVSKMLTISQGTQSYTIYNVDYVVYINDNIVSVVIRCTLKDSNNPQRVIIQTYNYDVENDKIITLADILTKKNLNTNDVQNKINSEIKSISETTNSMNEQGYSLYQRNANDNIYKLENTTVFFLGRQGYLYILYPYGNNNFTSEMDLILF